MGIKEATPIAVFCKTCYRRCSPIYFRRKLTQSGMVSFDWKNLATCPACPWQRIRHLFCREKGRPDLGADCEDMQRSFELVLGHKRARSSLFMGHEVSPWRLLTDFRREKETSTSALADTALFCFSSNLNYCFTSLARPKGKSSGELAWVFVWLGNCSLRRLTTWRRKPFVTQGEASPFGRRLRPQLKTSGSLGDATKRLLFVEGGFPSQEPLPERLKG